MEYLNYLVPGFTGLVGAGATWLSLQDSRAKQAQLLTNQLKRKEAELKKEASKVSNRDKELARLRSEKSDLTKKLDDLRAFQEKYNAVKGHLEKSSVVRDYLQPVILAGPRQVGKTSLLMQWHSPWNHNRLEATSVSKESKVPVYDFTMEKVEPHFADSSIMAQIHAHLALRVFDFPGDLSFQRAIRSTVEEETLRVRTETGHNLGVVIICMFNAAEAELGLSESTLSYYNGDLFRELRTLATHGKVHVEKLIFVFNKYDLLRKALSSQQADDPELLNFCIRQFSDLLSAFNGVCNPEKMSEVFTVLSREDMHWKNRGAPIVLGEAARGLVQGLAGQAVADEVIREAATNYASQIF